MDLTKITQLINSKYALETQTRQEVNRLLRESETMSEDKFWDNIYDLNEEIAQGEKRGQRMKDHIDNFFCHKRFTPAEALAFVKTYEDKVRAISSDRHYNHVADDEGYFCGDDSWGDLCDSFPLHGGKIYNDFLNREISRKHPAVDPNKIQENYMRMYLNEKVVPWLRDGDMDEDQAPDAVELLERELEDAKMLIRDLKGKLSKVQEIVS
jgi:hypothetical protein